MAILYRSNAFSRGFEEALMRARIPYVLVGDVGFYQRAEIKDALAFLRLATSPDDVQSDEALRRVINLPARGFGAKAMEVLETEAAWRQVSLLTALETAAPAAEVARRRARLRRRHPRRRPRPRSPRSPTSSRCCSMRPATAPCCARAAPRPPKAGWRTSRN